MTTPIADEARQLLQAAIDRKVDAVEHYASSQQHRSAAADNLQAAVAAEAEAWRRVKQEDWSDTELHGLGLEAPTGLDPEPKRRRRSTRRAAPAKQPEES